MTDVLFVYRSLTTVMDTAIRFLEGTPPPVSGDALLQIDNSSLVLLIDNTTNIQLGH